MNMFAPLPEETESLAKTVVDAAYKVHSTLGPGLLESVYETCLAHELRKRNVPVETQLVIPIVYDGVRLDSGLRIDMLKLTGLRLGLLINFNVPRIKNGIERIIL